MLLSLFSLFLSFFGVFQTEMGNGGVFGPAVRVIHMDSECEITCALLLTKLLEKTL